MSKIQTNKCNTTFAETGANDGAFVTEALKLASRPTVAWIVFGANAESFGMYVNMTAWNSSPNRTAKRNQFKIELDASDVGITANDAVDSSVSDVSERARKILSEADREQTEEAKGRRRAVELAEGYVKMYDPQRHMHCLFIIKEGIMVATLIENWFVNHYKYKRVSDLRFHR